MAVSVKPESTAHALDGSATADGKVATDVSTAGSSKRTEWGGPFARGGRGFRARSGQQRRYFRPRAQAHHTFEFPHDAAPPHGQPEVVPVAGPVPRRSWSAKLGAARRAALQGDRRGFILRRLLLLADAAALCVAVVIVEAFGGLVPQSHRSLALDLSFFLVMVPAWLLLLRAYGLYHVDSRRADHGVAEEIAPMLQMTALAGWSLLLALSALGVGDVVLTSLVLFSVSAFGLLLGFRAATRAWARRWPWYRQNTLVVGTPEESAALLAKTVRHPEYGINVVACLELPHTTGGQARVRSVDSGRLTTGDVDVLQVVADMDVDRVMLASSVGSLCERTTLLSELSERNVHVDLVPGWVETVGSRLEVTEMEGMPLLAVPRTRIPRSSLLLKRILDIAVSATLLVLLAPLLAACALAIKLDTPGPVLFRQRRVGRAGRRFQILKFRSMHEDADSRKHELVGLTLHSGASETGIFKVAADPRVTRVGRVLRRFSLDELPQLVNILRGDMSLVGPRPLPEDEHERITGRFRKRIDLMPGLTGLWQVHGRSDIPFEDMVGLDYLYVTNWSLWRDVKLLVRTVVVVARSRGAY
jgi:exopolysaccharide biosynthesis polyprenyl glycosylphosphotransferase